MTSHSVKHPWSSPCGLGLHHGFLNLRKSLSEPLLNTMGFRTSIKYRGFQNLRKIPWVSKPVLNTIALETSVKYHEFKNLGKIP